MPRPLSEIENSIAKQIREAIERGDFDDLPGKGKTLNLTDDPHVPVEWQLAFKMLKDANVAPKWIEQDKEIRQEKKKLEEWFARQAAAQKKGRAGLSSLPIDKIPAEHLRLQEARAEIVAAYRRRATGLNKVIDSFNLQAPSSRLQHPRIAIEDEIQRFLREGAE
ncbi:MAG: DUF1992 domain-containing protein [Chloroflexi bacterium]|nr:DUF1992 domain-containing protein [Chloroflexota bacterium]